MKLKLNMIISNSHRIKNLLLVIPLMIGIVACESDNPVAVNGELSVEEQIELGWEYFSQDDYNMALGEFEAAIGRDGNIADAHNGAGWSIGRLQDGLSEAASSFSQSLTLDTTMYDALGGWVFIAFQQGEWSSAIEKSELLLNRRTGWRFLHDSETNFQDIRLVMAQAHYNNLDFESSYQMITDYLNRSFVADVSTEEGRMELQIEIERLRERYGH